MKQHIRIAHKGRSRVKIPDGHLVKFDLFTDLVKITREAGEQVVYHDDLTA